MARDGEDRGIARRAFLRGAAGVALGAALSRTAPAGSEEIPPSGRRSKVVLVRSQRALLPSGRPDADVVARMLDEAVASCLGEASAAPAWKRIVSPTDTVGIKTNGWQYLPTPPEVEEALRRRVREAGVPAERIAVADHGVLGHEVFRNATALLNTRPMRTHHWAGVGSLVKNYIMFVEEPSAWHGDSCSDLAGIWSLPPVKGRTRLNVLVMLTPQFHSKGPHGFNPKYTWPYGGLIVSTDPVAADATGLRILQAKRRDHFGEDLPLETPAKHIEVAERKFGLGTADPSRIDLVRLGWAEGALV